MKKILIPIALLLGLALRAQEIQERELNSQINQITVFLKGAQVSRTGELNLKPGKTKLLISGLSPYIDEKSVQAKSTGDFTILSVNHSLNYLTAPKKDKAVDSLQTKVESIEEEVRLKTTRLEILKEKQSLLDENKVLTGDNSSLSMSQLLAAIEFYDRELTKIKDQELGIRRDLRVLKEKKEKIQKQIAKVSNQKSQPVGEITIQIESKVATQAKFDVSYMVSNAGWYPNYDVRVESVEKPIRLVYKADVYQNTGVEWKDVKLKFSNGDPNKSGVAPKLNTWYLNYPRNTYFANISRGISAYDQSVGVVSGRIVDDLGEPLPGVNVLVKGSTTGTQTDLNGNYSLTLPKNGQTLVFSYVGFETNERVVNGPKMDVIMGGATELQEVVVTGYSKGRIRGVSSISKAPITSTIENQTTVEFQIEDPYTIKSNGEKLSINLNEYAIESSYEYQAVPKLDKDAFLIARIINWDQYNLLEGEANLFFEDGYVGRTVLDAKSLSDTLEISLGRDKSVVIGRDKVLDFTKIRTIGSNKLESRGFETLVRNKKSQRIELTLFDQIPISVVGDINVEAIELSGGKLDEGTGVIEWKLMLEPNEQKILTLKYEVKYPKRERLVLE